VDDAELLERVKLGHALLLTLRGVPTIYAGDEQGFTGFDRDQGAREDQFGSKVAAYNNETLLGTSATTATPSFHTDHPLYKLMSELGHLRQAEPALRRGVQQLRFASEKPGLFAVSRFDPTTGRELLLAFNTSNAPLRQQVLVEVTSRHFASLHGQCAAQASAPGSLTVELPPLGFVACKAVP
jgi:glycosidase